MSWTMTVRARALTTARVLTHALVITTWTIATGCAEGVPTVSQSAAQTAGPETPPAGDSATAGQAAPLPAADVPPAGDPCAQGETGVCICEDTGTEGMRTCLFDADSPTGGFYSECRSCPAMAVDGCSDGAQGDGETDVDCGGAACDACADGDACVADGDCTSGTCSSGTCAMRVATPAPPPAAAPPPTGSSGMGCSGNASACTGVLGCCKADGSCGTGIGALCF